MTPNDSRPLIIRRATLDDVDRVVPFFEAYRAFYGKSPAPEQARDFLRDRLSRHESVILVAERAMENGETELVGFAQLYRALSSLSLGSTMILNDLFVSPDARRSGAARRLVEASIAQARAEGALRLELQTQHTNVSARALYDSLGFVADVEFAALSLVV